MKPDFDAMPSGQVRFVFHGLAGPFGFVLQFTALLLSCLISSFLSVYTNILLTIYNVAAGGKLSGKIGILKILFGLWKLTKAIYSIWYYCLKGTKDEYARCVYESGD
jgi:hypothetical protein